MTHIAKNYTFHGLYFSTGIIGQLST